MSGKQPDYAASLDFLRRWSPEGPWALTAIGVDRQSIVTATFTAAQVDAMRKWLESQGVGKNCYFHVNPLRRAVEKKAEREDVAALAWLHVDIDPRAGEDLAEERARALKLLEDPPGNIPPPTIIVFSGGGYQGFWRLKDPLPINGELARAEDAARYNLYLEVAFGADSCHNVDRIMRVPGTVNRPNEAKRKKGRTEEVARVVAWDASRVYDLSQFVQAPLVQGVTKGFGGGSVKVSGNVRRLESLDELPETVPGLLKVVIAQGIDPDEPRKWSSRSEALFWVCCELARHKVDAETIYAIITDPQWDISASVRDKGGAAERYALRQIERAREKAIDPNLCELNDEFAVVCDVGGRCRVIHEVSDRIDEFTGRTRISYMSFADVSNYFANRRVQWEEAGRTVTMPLGKWWLAHPQRRQYRTVVFAPGIEVEGAYNLWTGFTVDPKPSGKCDLFVRHVRENVCNENDEAFRYMMGWLATCVQRPANPGHTAVVLRGRQGTGKGVFANAIGALFGRHYMAVSDSNHIVGHFNAHLRDTVLLFADEAFYAGNKKHESLLKALITEPELVSEAKGVDAVVVPNYVHVIMASNEDWVVPAGIDDRRFFVLDVGDSKMQDSSFFGALDKEMRQGGAGALLHLLMNYDLGGFEVRRVPKTAALREQKMFSFGPDAEWWYSKLVAGKVFDEEEGWPEQVYASKLCYDYAAYGRAWGTQNRGNSTKLGRFFARCFPVDHRLRGQLSGEHEVVGLDGIPRKVKRPHVYLLPTLAECRRHWDEHFGGPYAWPDVQPVDSATEPEERQEPF